MGYWAGKDLQRFYIEDGVVLSGPRGVPIPIDPVTLGPLSGPLPSAPAVDASQEIEGKNVLKDFTDDKKVDDFVKEGKNVKPLEHAKDCKSGGRWGRYTPDCPKCEFLKKAK